MHRRRFFASLGAPALAVALPSPALAAARDGNWYRTLTATERVFLIQGILDGLNLAGAYLQDVALGSGSSPERASEIVDRFNAMCRQKMQGVSANQCFDGVNEFYGDFRNRKIMVPYAVEIVLLQIKGADEEYIQSVIRDYRAQS